MVIFNNEKSADGADGADGAELKSCSFCDFKCSNRHDFDIHILTHNCKQVVSTKKRAVNSKQFLCLECDFKCFKQSNYDRHISTNKHKKLMKDAKKRQHQQAAITTNTCANCNKQYSHPSGLCRHKRICRKNNSYNDDTTIDDNAVDYTDTDTDTEFGEDKLSQRVHVIIRKNTNNNLEKNNDNTNQDLIAENREMKMMMMTLMTNHSQLYSQMLEMLKASQMTTTNPSATGIASNVTGDHNATTNNNNTFNMNLFLNEKCKDAMNMKDFVNSIQLNMTDLENVGRLGYVEGMSNILIDNLQKTDVYKRPVHCSDIKRETLYVKDNNQWERDGPDHQKMTNAVLAVEQKNVALVNEWAKANPRCMNSNTRENEKYFKLSKAATDGEKDGNIDKVIRKVAKKVIIEKDIDASST